MLQVFRSVRTGITCEGREAMGICLYDLADSLPFRPDIIEKVVINGSYGKKKNVSKDFLPRGSTDINIKRPHNYQSRKCLVIWLDKNVPSELKSDLIKGKVFNPSFFKL